MNGFNNTFSVQCLLHFRWSLIWKSTWKWKCWDCLKWNPRSRSGTFSQLVLSHWLECWRAQEKSTLSPTFLECLETWLIRRSEPHWCTYPYARRDRTSWLTDTPFSGILAYPSCVRLDWTWAQCIWTFDFLMLLLPHQVECKHNRYGFSPRTLNNRIFTFDFGIIIKAHIGVLLFDVSDDVWLSRETKFHSCFIQ